MKIYKSITELNNSLISQKGIVIGNFDGVHLGHLHLLNKFIDSCEKLNIEPVLVTLSPHPHIYFQGRDCASLLSLANKKLSLLKLARIKNILEIDFTPSIQSMDATAFIQNYLLKIDKLSQITLGHDFALGNGKENSKEILIKQAPSHILIEETTPLKVRNKICSSTNVRESLKIGNVEEAAEMLGRHYSLVGEVVKGKGNGRTHLVPTANIEIDSTLLIPRSGVYYSSCKLDGKVYSSITNIGYNPTIEINLGRTIETHLLNFDRELYGKKLEVIFLDRCRDEKKFSSLEDLKLEILKNIEQRKVFKC